MPVFADYWPIKGLETAQSKQTCPPLPWNGGRCWRLSFQIFCESFFKDPTSQDSTFPPCLFLETWRTWRFLANHEMVSYDMYQPSEVAVKIPSKSKIRNPIKTLHVLQALSWSLRGHGGSWWTWRWCLINGSILMTYSERVSSRTNISMTSTQHIQNQPFL